MFFNDNLWTIAFVLTTAMVTAVSVMFWVGIREFVMHRNWRSLLFGGGMLSVAFGFLAMNLYNSAVLPWHLVIPFNIGFGLIGLSLINRKWQYLFVLFALGSFIVPLNSAYFPVAVAPILVLSWLAYKNFCLLSCHHEECERKNRESIEWSIIFLLFFLSLSLTAISRGGYYDCICNYAMYGTLFLRLAIVSLLFWHILKCMSFSSRERMIFPVVVGFITVLITMGFLINRSIVSYVETNLKTESLSEARAAKALSEKECLVSTGLSKRIKEKDVELNDLADKILVKTGIRTVYFAGNERIAAAPSATGKGRFLGSTIEDPQIKSAVLEKGEEFVGKIEKGGEIAIAAYVPVFDGDKIVGMVGSGRFLTDFYKLQKEIFYQTAAGLGAVFFVTILTIVSSMPVLEKRKKRV